MNRTEPTDALIDTELMLSLLEAALSTARARRNTPEELFALGQAEAMANAFYVMIMTQGLESLEARCQAIASDVQDRLAELAGRRRPASRTAAPKARPMLAVVS
jgi:hypothetical protein